MENLTKKKRVSGRKEEKKLAVTSLKAELRGMFLGCAAGEGLW